MAKKYNMKEQVYQHLIDMIISGTLKENEKIDEEQICEDLRVSRTPVREALLLLENEGIISHSPRKGFSIRVLSAKEMAELYKIVGALEGLAADIACDSMTETVLKEMEFYTLSMDLALDTENYMMYYRTQMKFHDLFIKQSGNKSLADQLNLLKGKLTKHDYGLSNGSDKVDYLRSANEEHKTMVKMFRNKDRAGLRKLLEESHWTSDLASVES